MLYHYPATEVKNWAVPLNKANVRTIKDQLPFWDIDAYLPSDTLIWCQTFLDLIQFSSSRNQGDRTKPFLEIYIRLKNAILIHNQSGESPELSLLQKPRDTANPFVRDINFEGGTEADLVTDGT